MAYSYPFNLITEYVIKEHHVDVNEEYEIIDIPARKLICPERIDFMAKWIYIDSLEKGIDMTDATNMYVAHLDAFSLGTFVEPGKEWKNSVQIYLDTFNKLISDIKIHGFDNKKSIIPVGGNGAILDGSHRVVVAAYYGYDVTIIRIPHASVNFSAGWFRNNLLESKYLDWMISKYIEVTPKCYVACMWPVAIHKEKLKTSEDIISEYGDIIYKRDIELNKNGMKNFMSQIYGHQVWTGNFENQYQGVDTKVKPCYKKGKPVHTVVFTANSLDEVLKLKEKIRNIYKLENHSIHITDSEEEALQLAELLYNYNSVQHLKFGVPYKFVTVNRRIENFKKNINENGLELSRFIIDGESVLEIFGFCTSKKLTFLTDYREMNLPKIEKSDYYISEVNDLIYNPNNYFIYKGIKFVALEKLLALEKNKKLNVKQRVYRLMNRCIRRTNKTRICEENMLRNEREKKMYGKGLMKIEDYIFCVLKENLKKKIRNVRMILRVR